MLRPRKRLLLDVDGVIYNFIDLWRHCANYVDVHTEDTDRRDWNLSERYGLTDEDDARVEGELMLCDNRVVVPFDGALAGIKTLQRSGWDIYYVTQPLIGNHQWEDCRRQWFRHYGLDDNRLVFTSQKHICSGDVFVDDNADNVINWKAHNPNGIGYPFGDVGIVTPQHWLDLIAYLSRLSMLQSCAVDWETKGQADNPIMQHDLKENGGWL